MTSTYELDLSELETKHEDAKTGIKKNEAYVSFREIEIQACKEFVTEFKENI